jgi:hypothetical protein
VARFNFSCTLIGNHPQSLTGHIVKRYATFRVKSKAEEGKIMTEKIAPNLGDVQTTLLLPLWGRAVEYNTPANSGHRVNLLKTIKFTHYVKDKKKTQCSL